MSDSTRYLYVDDTADRYALGKPGEPMKYVDSYATVRDAETGQKGIVWVDRMEHSIPFAFAGNCPIRSDLPGFRLVWLESIQVEAMGDR